MTVKFEITGDKQAAKVLKQLATDFPKEAAQTLNRTAARTKTRTLREMVKRTLVPRKDLKNRIRDYKANPRTLRASVWIGTRRRVPLVKVAARKRGGVKLNPTRPLRGGEFRATMRSGHTGIYRRQAHAEHESRPDGQRTQLPIQELTVNITEDGSKIIQAVGTEQMRDYFPTEFKRRVKRVIDRRAARKRRR